MYKIICITTILILIPIHSFASTVYFDVSDSQTSVGETVTITVKLDTEGKQINLVEGNISLNTFTDMYDVVEVVYEDSILTLWPNKPLFSKTGDVISFTGGQPGGFTSNSASLFKIVLKAKKIGEIVLIPKNINAYINDGKGTQDTVTEKTLAIKIDTPKTFLYTKYGLPLTILLLLVVLYLVIRFFLKNKKLT